MLFDLVPVAAGGLFRLVVAVLVVFPVFQLVRQVLLAHPVAGEVVGIEIPLLPLQPRRVGVDILQFTGDVPYRPAFTSAMAAAMP